MSIPPSGWRTFEASSNCKQTFQERGTIWLGHNVARGRREGRGFQAGLANRMALPTWKVLPKCKRFPVRNPKKLAPQSVGSRFFAGLSDWLKSARAGFFLQPKHRDDHDARVHRRACTELTRNSLPKTSSRLSWSPIQLLPTRFTLHEHPTANGVVVQIDVVQVSIRPLNNLHNDLSPRGEGPHLIDVSV